MSRYSATVDNIISDYYESSPSVPLKRTPRLSEPRVPDTITLPTLERSTTQSTSTTVTSTANLLGGHRRTSSHGKSFLSGWRFHGPRRKDHDREEMGQDAQNDAVDSRPPMKPWHGWKVILTESWLNVLLVFLPASWIVDSVMEDSHTLVFIFCILAMLPLVKLHELATHELVGRIGGSRTGLLNASMGNTVELVIATTALRKCELRVVQSSLIGGMLSKLLLVLGMCFFAGGVRFSEQDFDPTATGIQSSLLSISVGAVLLPAAYHFSLSGGTNSASNEQKADILRMSHGVAIILLFIYVAYLLFQLWSHTHLFQDKKRPGSLLSSKSTKGMHSRSPTAASSITEKEKVSPTYENIQDYSPSSIKSSSSISSQHQHRNPYTAGTPFASGSDLSLPMTNPSSSSSSTIGFVYSKAAPAPALNSTVKLVHDGRHGHAGPATELPSSTGPDFYPERNRPFDEETYVERPGEERSEEAETHKHVDGRLDREPKLSWPLTVGLLVVIAVLVAINAEWLVESMNGLSTESISKEWIALILLPTVSCIAECVTAINVSVKDQLTLSISVAVGSTIQTALFVIPFMIVLGWILDKPLAMLFDPFESVVLYISVHVMGYVVADGKSNWLEGVILICLYIIIAVSFWFYPGSTFSSTLAVCASDPHA